MSCLEPTDDCKPIVFQLCPSQLSTLRPLLAMVLDGLREELSTQPATAVREPARLRREEVCWVNLLAALAGEAVVPSRELRRVVREFAESTDAANDYERVVAEHEALSSLLAQLGGAWS